MKKLFIGVAKILITTMILALLFIGFITYKRYPIDQYCKNVPLNIDYEEAVALANEAGLFPIPKNDNKESLVVLSQRSPFFRFACKCTFSEGKLASKTPIAGD